MVNVLINSDLSTKRVDKYIPDSCKYNSTHRAYMSKYQENDTKKCAMNLTKRMKFIDENYKENFIVESYTLLEDSTLCLCGHKLCKDLYIIKSEDDRDITLMIGSKCIKRFENPNMNKQMLEVSKIWCELCCKSFKDPNHKTSVTHKKNMIGRKCKKCKKRAIPLEAPQNYRYCKDCCGKLLCGLCNKRFKGNVKYKSCYTCNKDKVKYFSY